MNLNADTLKDFINEKKIESMIVAGIDMQGKLFGKKIPAKHFLDIMNEGVYTCAVNLAWDVNLNFLDNYDFCSMETGLHDIKLVPDLTTLRLYPGVEKTAIVLGDLFEKNQEPVTVAPRNILKKQIEKAEGLGFKAFAASELEFYVYKENHDSVREKGFNNLQPLSPYPIDYSISRLNIDDWFLSKIVNEFEKADIDIESVKGELGKGQYEINFKYSDSLTMADQTAIYKSGTKEIAAVNGLLATFMAKPDTNDAGSSGHTHISLWDSNGENNLFYDPSSTDGLSKIAKHFLAGMLELTPELMVLYAPYINSYKRIINTGGAPSTNTWGIDNRTTAYRIDGKNNSCRVENRIPGADANFYLVMAACLASGLYGIENELELPSMTTTDAYVDPNVPQLPTNLVEALDRFKTSERVKEILGEDVVKHYTTAVENEIRDYFFEVTDWERRKYLEHI
ncbi:glutamine synthetase family protein [Sporosarcina sp. FSL W7-1349]|uniref:glutamine synthetase family protein n=1 Tax=Sporosarcina sp. FSL W7-1349 TaxID=2921561 RepID=UPI0030FB1B3C